MQPPFISLKGITHNNLKKIDVEIPSRKLTVITGLSGSGKSSLAFDTLYAEGQRRYIESLSTYTRQFLAKMPKPDVESVRNIPPAIALEQRNHVVNSRSTVGTQTEVLDYLRVMYARIGKTVCIDCGGEVKKLEPEGMKELALRWLSGRKAAISAMIQTHRPTDRKKSKRPSALKSKFAPKRGASVASIVAVLQSQGYRRVLFASTPPALPRLIDLEESTPDDLKQLESADTLEVVTDRIKLQAVPDAESRIRISDSISQALSIGKGRFRLTDLDSGETRIFDGRFACLACRRDHSEPSPLLFSFNSPLGACGHCSGFGFTLDLDENLVVPDFNKTLRDGAIDPFTKPSFTDWQKDLFKFASQNDISLTKKYRELTASQKEKLWKGVPGNKTFPGIIACFEELKQWKYKIYVRVFIRRYQSQNICTVCEGHRLKRDALAVRVSERNLPDVLAMPLTHALDWISTLKLDSAERKIAEDITVQVKRRLEFLVEVGVGYLTLARQTRTLSGGEFQRINLATQLGNGLCGTLYVLDEPSIGLHASDTERLIRVLKRLRDQGNTVVVVEHDTSVLKTADWVIELGPLAGARGGELVAMGPPENVAHIEKSLTGAILRQTHPLGRSQPRRPPSKRTLKIKGCRENNLKNVTFSFPLDRFVVVTGVSGSGKSTLVHTTLYRALAKAQGMADIAIPGRYDALYGAEQLSGIALLDQSPIGKSSRSNPATYLKAWDEVRRIFSHQVLALRRGYTPQYFSFNVDGGRCPVCSGEGEITLDMHFMAEVRIPCEECGGKRFKKNILDVTFKGRNIYDILTTTIDEAAEIFRDSSPLLMRKISVLRDVGLGYLQFGQSATTLSGGESQRLKIAASLDLEESRNRLYLFDEPTTGLHQNDVRRLISVIQDLVSAGNSVLMIEHHLDMIYEADWVVDLGPGGGENGGMIVAEGTPDDLMKNANSLTGKMLFEAGYLSQPRS